MSIRTIALTLRPTPDHACALEQVQDAFAAACNHISAVAWKEQKFGRRALQHLAYQDARVLFGLKAQHAIRAIAVVADSYRAERSRQHAFRSGGRSGLRYPTPVPAALR